MKTALLILMLIGSCSIHAEDALDKKKLLREGAAERKERIAEIKAALVDFDEKRAAKKGAGSVSLPFGAYESKLEEYSQKGNFYPTLKMEEFSRGVFRDTEFVRQPKPSWQGGTVVVVKVIDADNVVVKWMNNQLVWLSATPTKSLADGMSLRPKGIFRFAGNREYSTGKAPPKTIFWVERIDDE